jgi:hypothetical protein
MGGVTKTLSQNQNTKKRGKFVPQVVEGLPHIFEVLSSIPIEKNKLTVRVQTWSFS